MAMATSPFLLNNLTVSLKKIKNADGTAAVGGAREEYRCQLNTASLTPSSGTGTSQTYETFCSTFDSGGAGSSTWVLNLAGFQSYTDVADLSIILFNDEGAVYEYVLQPMGGVTSATNAGFMGEVTIIPTVIGGTANQYATFTVDLPCVQKPVMLTAPAPAVFAAAKA